MVFSQVVSDQTYFTGLAILNPNNTPVSVTIELFSAGGVAKASVEIAIAARYRISQVVQQLFRGHQRAQQENSISGYIWVTADQGVVAFSAYGTNDLKTLSAIPPQIIR